MENSHQYARRFAMALARVLLRLAAERGWKPGKLATVSGVTRDVFYRAEKGETCISLFGCLQASHALGVPMAVIWQLAEAEMGGKPGTAMGRFLQTDIDF